MSIFFDILNFKYDSSDIKYDKYIHNMSKTKLLKAFITFGLFLDVWNCGRWR